jgi:hypothetical protein
MAWLMSGIYILCNFEDFSFQLLFMALHYKTLAEFVFSQNINIKIIVLYLDSNASNVQPVVIY